MEPHELLEHLMSRIMGSGKGMPGIINMRVTSDGDLDAVEIAQKSANQARSFLTGLARQKDKLAGIENRLNSGFADKNYVVSTLSGFGPSVSFFPETHTLVGDNLADLVSEHLTLNSSYQNSGYIFNSFDQESSSREGAQSQKKKRSKLSLSDLGHSHGMPSEEDIERLLEERLGETGHDIRNAKKIVGAVQGGVTLYAKGRLVTTALVDKLEERLKGYSKYLAKRFVKTDEEEDKSNRDPRRLMLMTGLEEDSIMGRYVKCPFFKGNPVLTDILLELVDAIPQHSMVARGRKKKLERTLSPYAVDTAAETLSALSDPKLLEYVSDPRKFFQYIALALSDFRDVMSTLERYQLDLINMPHMKTEFDPETRRRLASTDLRKINRVVERVKNMDLDGIIQNPDDVAPDNSRESQLFKHRAELFETLYGGMQTLSEISDPYHRFDKAKDIITTGVDTKDKLADISTSRLKRKLRTDRDTDNEFYTGTKTYPGEFGFVRSPTPEVKLDDVIGKSFDRAKGHLREIIETAQASRVLKLTAPGRKVKSNILLIGPYGCGKTELARGACADQRVIGAFVSIADTLTAYAHESVSNVKRVYDKAAALMEASIGTKPVVLALDEFDGWFMRGNGGSFTDTDMHQVENVMLEVLDGVKDYSGIVTMAMTNNPQGIPPRILRRFRHVDVVGELTQNERAEMLKMYLERSIPINPRVGEYYIEWAGKLENAPGDVVRKVVDELHFDVVPKFIVRYGAEAARIEKVLAQRESKNGSLTERDAQYVRRRLASYNIHVTPEQVGNAIDSLLTKPHIARQIKDAKQVYSDAKDLMERLANGQDIDDSGFGFRSTGNRKW